MRRREFMGLIWGAASFWPVTVSAQQTTRIPRVVYLSPADIPVQVTSYRTQMRELGYVEGRNIRLEFRDATATLIVPRPLREEVVGAGDIDAIMAISTPAPGGPQGNRNHSDCCLYSGRSCWLGSCQ